jgi:hypothetical protein
LKSAASNAPFFTSDDRTAFGLICADPTLLRGSLIAAYEVPHSAANNARYATTVP